MDHQNQSLAYLAQEVGLASPNLTKDALGVEPQLCAEFQPCSPNRVAIYREHTHTQNHLYYVDEVQVKPN